MLFPMDLKELTLTLITRKMIVLKKLITGQLVSYQFYPKLLNVVCTTKFISIQIIFSMR